MQIFFYRDYELQKFFFWAVLKRVPFWNVLEKIGPKGNLLFSQFINQYCGYRIMTSHILAHLVSVEFPNSAIFQGENRALVVI